ncbi:unnamed protein product [Caenorhabditis auriculariae]|uniref:Uncharacterized protein n=1 Tax=Caenorhabditis auriculariae TaxID=2777116 RepID=A0A8S1GX99_9PELO|nr:unnamed protein product [Caenorhabditis auriculariae]
MDQRFLSTLIAYTSIIAFTINFVIKSNIIGKFSNFSQFSTDSEKIDVKSQKALFFIGWMILSHLPSSNLFFNVGFVLAERILYMTNVGFCGFVGLGLQVLLDRKPAYKSAISINPPKAFANLGHVYAARGESKKASEVYELALNYRPNMADTWYNLGILKKMTTVTRKTFAAAMLNLALVEWDLGLEPTALARLEVCQSINGEDGKFYRHHQVTLTHCGFNKGRLLASKGKHSEAAEAYEKALKNAPKGYENAAALLNSLGETYAKLGDDLQAERCFQKALEANPKHVNAYITLAHLRIRQNRSTEASSWLSKARSLAPESPTVLQQAAQAAFVIGNLNNSETLFREALRLDRTHAESLHGLANVLRELGRNEESEEVLARLCEVRPDDPVAVANYAATLHLNEKHDHALKMYDRALRLNPADRTTAENRAKLLRTMRRNTLL